MFRMKKDEGPSPAERLAALRETAGPVAAKGAARARDYVPVVKEMATAAAAAAAEAARTYGPVAKDKAAAAAVAAAFVAKPIPQQCPA